MGKFNAEEMAEQQQKEEARKEELKQKLETINLGDRCEVRLFVFFVLVRRKRVFFHQMKYIIADVSRKTISHFQGALKLCTKQIK